MAGMTGGFLDEVQQHPLEAEVSPVATRPHRLVRPVAPGGHSLFGGGQQPSWLFLRGLGGSRGPRPRLPVFVGDQPTGPLAAGVTLRMGLCLVWSDPRGLDRADFPVLSLELLG